MVVWNRENAKHLLSRALFGYTRADLDKALTYSSLSEFVNKELLASQPLPAAPNTWITEVPIANDPNQGNRYREFTYWWYDLMRKEGLSVREKMVMFMHNHYVSQRSKVTYPQHMYIQNDLFRRNAFGNFIDLTKAVAVDPAMLIYLDGQQNNGKTTPNENFARELMELFTIGVGNYTENDVKQAAKAVSGWQLTGLTPVFNAARWPSENKTILGQTGNFKVDDVVNILFAKDATATFLCTKLCKEFLYYQPDAAFVAKMAKVMRDNKYQIKPVLQFLFTADEFFAPQLKGSKIKTPTELMISGLKVLDFDNIKTADWAYIYDAGRNMQQQLLEPPNVAGWPGQREWISSNTYPQRNGFTDAILFGRSYNGVALSFKVNTINYAKSFNTKSAGEISEDALKLVEQIADTFFQIGISAKKKDFLLQTLLDGTILSNWSTSTPMADARIQKLLRAVMRSAEFQLC